MYTRFLIVVHFYIREKGNGVLLRENCVFLGEDFFIGDNHLSTVAYATKAAIDIGATAWMLTSTALVLLMIPDLAMFYSGLVRTKMF